jgi:hypothetical protein
MLIDDPAGEQEAREIELELVRVRSAAEAARLESRAAELELMLRRMARAVDSSQSAGNSSRSTCDAASSAQETRITRPFVEPAGQGGEGADHWSGRLLRLQSRQAPAPVATEKANSTLPLFDTAPLFAAAPLSDAAPEVSVYWTPQLPNMDAGNAKLKDEQAWIRAESGSSQISPPHFSEPSPEPVSDSISTPVTERKPEFTKQQVAAPDLGKRSSEELVGVAAKASQTLMMSDAIEPRRSLQPVPKIQPIREVNEEESPRKFRPTSWFVSTLAHLAVLVLLGFMTLANNPPKDQLAFTASAAESSEETMETFSIETSEPTEPTEPVSDTAYEISDMGTMAITEVSMEVPTAPAAPSSSELFSRSSSSLNSSLMKSLKGDSNTKMQFCGVDGGGSHFVYLVDSSGSMRDGFQSARNELLASIDQLKPDQRFYVIFFDKQPSYMRIQDPDVDEPASVMATPENKKRLRRWAMTVEMNEGKAPYEVLPFALRLRPDVIFLLSDGEFPSRIEEILRQQNYEENLFGESRLISIVHTIRYHGLEGEIGRKAEATMVKIAKENGGQYRHVPKPK